MSKIKLTQQEKSSPLWIDSEQCYFQVVRENKDGYTVGFYKLDGSPLWKNSERKIKYLYEKSNAIISLGNEMKEKWSFLTKK